jgi:putative (di)nucleoside polyphosphate hydrolase
VRQSRRDRRHAARAINTAAERDPQAQAQDEEKDIKVEYLEEYRNNVGLCVVNREGKVFAARRVDDPTGAWQMPQGGIDKGEFARDSALRELEEETGIPSQLVEIVAEAEDWLAYDFPTSVRERIAKRFVKKHHTNGNSSKKFRKKVYKGQRQKWFLLRFTGAEADIDLASRGEEHREFSEWRWIALQNLPQQVVPFKRLVYEQVTDQFCPLIDKHF